MADRPAIKARVLSRKEAAALTDDPRLRMALEAIFGDVSATLPDAALANAQAAEGAQSTADQAVTDAAAAQSTADAAQTAAEAAQTTADAAQSAAAAAQSDIDEHELLTAAHGTTGAVVGTTDTQTLTNKTLGTGTKLSGQTLAPGTGTPTLGAAGPVGAPSTWLRLNINGVDYLMPLWLA